jgi:hypothetical protein
LNAVRQELEKRTAKVVEQKVAKSEDQRSSVKVIEADGEKVSVMYYLKYAAAKQAAGVLNEFFAGSKEYRIAANEAQNSILIQCPPDKFRRIENLLKQLDAKQPRSGQAADPDTVPNFNTIEPRDPTSRTPEDAATPRRAVSAPRKQSSLSIQTSITEVGSLLEWAETYGQAVSEVKLEGDRVSRLSTLVKRNAISSGDLAEAKGRHDAAIRRLNLLEIILKSTIEGTVEELEFTSDQIARVKEIEDVSINEVAPLQKEMLRLRLRMKVLQEILNVSK